MSKIELSAREAMVLEALGVDAALIIRTDLAGEEIHVLCVEAEVGVVPLAILLTDEMVERLTPPEGMAVARHGQ